MGVEQRSGSGESHLDRLLTLVGRHQSTKAQEPASVPEPSQNEEPSVVRARKREGREFFNLGGTIREAELAKDAGAVNGLYVHPFAIEHLADVTPSSSSQELKAYYKTSPDSKLLIAELDGQIVGVITIAPQKGINEVKLNRLVRREDKPGLDIGNLLIREALVRSFLKKPEEGGPGGITIGVILDVEGSEAARKAFKKFGFETTIERATDRCWGWSKKRKKLVLRDVEQMFLARERYAMRYGNDLHRGTSLPNGKAA